MIECVDAVTIEEAREIREHQDIDQESATDTRPRRARKTPHRLLTILYIMISKGDTLVHFNRWNN
jgi:hypothetical protein